LRFKQYLIFSELEQAEELGREIKLLAELVAKFADLNPYGKHVKNAGGALSHEIGWYCERKRDELVSKLYKSIRELEQLKFE